MPVGTSLKGILARYNLPPAPSTAGTSASDDSESAITISTSRRPYFTSADLDADRAVVFIGGLFNGMLEPSYIVALSDALEKAKWRLVQFYWTGSYEGFGTGSLDRDVAEMSSLIQHLRSNGVKKVVIMGHSTGSQDVIHYLTSPTSQDYPNRENVKGGIMQAPASDREYFQNTKNADSQAWMDALKDAEALIKEGKKDQLMSPEFCKTAGCPMSAYRLHSLVGIGGDDDYFSSDIPDAPADDTPHVHPLSSSFGKLSVPALALWSEKDEYGFLDDQKPLLERWEKASKGKLSTKIIDGASHGVPEEDGQVQLTETVVAWLKEHFGE